MRATFAVYHVMHMVSFGNNHPIPTPLKLKLIDPLIYFLKRYRISLVSSCGMLNIISCFSFSSRDSQSFQDSLTELNLGVDVICHKPLNIVNDNTSTSN